MRDPAPKVLCAIAAVALCSCRGCGSVDYTVSSPTTDPNGLHRSFAQSETSMVRLDLPSGRPPGEPAARFLVGYNDDTDAVADAGAACWAFVDRASVDGWARSDAYGGDWMRQEQLPVSGALQEAGVHARHGDPWLAAWSSNDPQVPGLVLYVSVAQSTLARYGGPWFLLLTRSMDGGKTFEDSKVVLGPQAAVPDGPKVAITGDGMVALVTWNDAATGGVPFEIVWNLDRAVANGGMSVGRPGAIVPTAVALPPDPSCTFAGAAAHPRVAAGRTTLYVAAVVQYACSGGFVERLEVYRNPSIGIAFGAPFQRILSAAPPASLAAGFGVLNAQNATGTPRFGASSDRGSSLPSLAVGQDSSGEFAVVADLVLRPGTAPGEATVEKVVQWRIAGADTCSPGSPPRDLAGCGTSVGPQEVDAIAKGTDMSSVGNRAGIWESKPAVFSGRVPDGTADPRVGIVWYSQPYKGLLNATDEMRTRTIVEGVVSTDGGVSYEGPFTLTALRDGDPANAPPDANIGLYFYPCQILCTSYYGEYLSGAFQFLAPSATPIVGTWGDSREGCTAQAATTRHQHVWAGAVRPR